MVLKIFAPLPRPIHRFNCKIYLLYLSYILILLIWLQQCAMRARLGFVTVILTSWIVKTNRLSLQFCDQILRQTYFINLIMTTLVIIARLPNSCTGVNISPKKTNAKMAVKAGSLEAIRLATLAGK